MFGADLVSISITIGSIYALMAVGLTLTLAVLKLPNLAHAELITVGAYSFVVLIDFFSVNALFAFLVAAVIGALFAVVGEIFVYRPLNSRKASRYILILASFAFGLIVRYSLYIWAANYNILFLQNLISNDVVFVFGGLSFNRLASWIIPVTISMTVFVHLLLNRTLVGKSMRSMESNIVLSRISGVNTKRITLITWAIVGSLTGLGGAFWSIQTQVHPEMGFDVLLDVFAIVVLAGLTSFYGTLVGSYVISFSENLFMGYLNSAYGISLAYQPIIPFVVIIVVLLVRPSGLQKTGSTNGLLQYLRSMLRRSGSSAI